MKEVEKSILIDTKSIKKIKKYHQIISSGLHEAILDIAKNRNFEIEQKKGDILFKKGNQIVSLKSFLPEGFIFSNSRKKENHTMANVLLRKITYKKEQFESKYFPLIIAHEIGHMINDSKKDLGEMFGKKLKASNKLYNGKKTKEIDKDFWDNHIKEKSESERQARYTGYKLLKKLENKGFNVFDDLTQEQVFAFIKHTLKTYKYSEDKNKFGDITDTNLFVRKESYLRYFK